MKNFCELTVPQKLLQGDADIFGDLTQQNRRDIASGMKWNGRASSVGMTELLVGPALAYLLESQPLQNRNDLAGLENRYAGHSRNFDGLDSDKLRLNMRRAVLTQHLDNLLQVDVEFIKGLGLRMSSGKTGNVTHIEAGIRATLNYCGISFHKRAPIGSDADDSSRTGLRA